MANHKHKTRPRTQKSAKRKHKAHNLQSAKHNKQSAKRKKMQSTPRWRLKKTFTPQKYTQHTTHTSSHHASSDACSCSLAICLKFARSPSDGAILVKTSYSCLFQQTSWHAFQQVWSSTHSPVTTSWQQVVTKAAVMFARHRSSCCTVVAFLILFSPRGLFF